MFHQSLLNGGGWRRRRNAVRKKRCYSLKLVDGGAAHRTLIVFNVSRVLHSLAFTERAHDIKGCPLLQLVSELRVFHISNNIAPLLQIRL